MAEPPVEASALPDLVKGDPFYRSVLVTASGICAGHMEQRGTSSVAHIEATSPEAKFDILLLRHHYLGTSEDILTVDGEGFAEGRDETWSVKIQLNGTFEEESVLETLKWNEQGTLGRLDEKEKERFLRELANIDKGSITPVR